MLDNDNYNEKMIATILTILMEQKNRNSIDLSLNRFGFFPFFEMLYCDIDVLTRNKTKRNTKIVLAQYAFNLS